MKNSEERDIIDKLGILEDQYKLMDERLESLYKSIQAEGVRYSGPLKVSHERLQASRQALSRFRYVLVQRRERGV